MSTYTIPLDGELEASISVEPSLQGLRAHSLLFNDDADIVAETDSTQYIDYCHTEVCAREIFKLLESAGIDYAANVWDDLSGAGMPECVCD